MSQSSQSSMMNICPLMLPGSFMQTCQSHRHDRYSFIPHPASFDAFSGGVGGKGISRRTWFFSLENMKSLGSSFFLFQLNSCAGGFATFDPTGAAAAAAGLTTAAGLVLLTTAGAAEVASTFAFLSCTRKPTFVVKSQPACLQSSRLAGRTVDVAACSMPLDQGLK